MGRYYTAEVCLRGHANTDRLESSPKRDRFCSDFGSEIIHKRPTCSMPIRGDCESDYAVFIGGGVSPAPSYRFNCGKPFPWTAEKIDTAKELANEIEELTPEQRASLKTAIDDISKEGPRTDLGVARIKKILGPNAGGAGKALWNAAVSIGTEAAKRGLLG